MNQLHPSKPADCTFASDTRGLLQVFPEPQSSPEVDEISRILPQSLINSFSAATGWELAVAGNEIKIVDMSENWPAKTPTAHRGKCDQFAKELSLLLLGGN